MSQGQRESLEKVARSATAAHRDRVGQLTQERFPDGRTTSCTYDPVGNLLSLTDATGTVRYAYNAVML
jgi:uncharacterized protein RhaS with RHS repeats